MNKKISTLTGISVVILLSLIVGLITFFLQVRVGEQYNLQEKVEKDPTTEDILIISKNSERLCERTGYKFLPEKEEDEVEVGSIRVGSFSAPNKEEVFVSCQHRKDPSSFDRYFYITDFGGNVVYQREDLGELEKMRTSYPFRILDVSEDGTLEIVWGGIDWGGGKSTTTTYLFSLSKEELFSKKTGLETAWSEELENMITATVGPVFSDNLERRAPQAIKDYLLSVNILE